MLPVVRGRPLLNPPSSWFSMEIGKFWSRGIVRGSCEWIMMPLLRSV
jgi:hypothetical protein